jgi:hypothetical protein
VSVHGVGGGGDAVEVEAGTVGRACCEDVGEGGPHVLLAAELRGGELAPGEAPFLHLGAELEGTPEDLGVEVQALFERLLQPLLADVAPGADDIGVDLYAHHGALLSFVVSVRCTRIRARPSLALPNAASSGRLASSTGTPIKRP